MSLKRALDIILSMIAITLLSPLFLAIGAFIKLRSPGPILFKQARVGLNGHEFKLLKFRSMHTNTVIVPNMDTTVRHDARVFPGGQIIRKYKLDELPQFFNVLIGDMSIIGPRPTVKEDYEKMSQAQRRRVGVRPGLSGLAQISGNTSLSWPDRIELDLQYIDSLSLWGDVKIMLRTCSMILKGQADTHPATRDEWS